MSKMRSENGTKPRRPRARFGLLFLLLGVVIGVAGTIFVPGLLRSHLPDLQGALDREGEPFRGVVSTKQADADRLVLTVSTSEGTIFATFSDAKKVDEIGLLIQEGDSITLELRGYTPFVDDPTIARVLSLSTRGNTLPAVDSATTKAGGDTATTKPDTGAAEPDTAIIKTGS